MQAIRVLRAQSRPASPAPASFAPTDSFAQGSVASIHVEEPNGARPANAFSRIQNFAKRAVPTPPPSSSPSPTPSPGTITQDGTYLQTLGMKLNEAVSRVLTMPVLTGSAANAPDVWKAKKPIPIGRAKKYTVLFETELDASQGNVNLRHAILRLLPRSLHVLVSSVSTQVSQLLPHSAYVPSSLNSPLHPTTIHALALAQFCSEILDTFNVYKLGTANSDLAVIRSHLETLIARITGPLFGQLQVEMHSLLEALAQPYGATNSPASFPGSKKEKPHPAILALGQNMPTISKALKRYTFATCPATQASVATFHINALWFAMIQLAHRTPTLPPHKEDIIATMPHKTSFHTLAYALTPPGSPLLGKKLSPPASPPATLKKLTPPGSPPAKKWPSLPGLQSSPLVNTLALAGDSPPKPEQLKLRHHPSTGSLESRSSSPDTRSGSASSSNLLQSIHRGSASSSTSSTSTMVSSSTWLMSLASDSKAVFDILASPDVPRPLEGSLPREAVDETYERLAAFKHWLANGACGGFTVLVDSVPEEVPLLVALPVLLGEAWLGVHAGPMANGLPNARGVDAVFPGIAMLLGYDSEEAYRRTAACGFRRADDCEDTFGRYVLDRLEGHGEWMKSVMEWVKARLEM